MKRPTFKEERLLVNKGFEFVVGVDEAGCGALAGPIIAAAVVLPLNSRLSLIRDSKLLTKKQRQKLFQEIKNRSQYIGIGRASEKEIFNLGLRKANLVAMKRAVRFVPKADFALIDAWNIPNLGIPQKSIIRGDRKIKSIAAASIIAKVTRDTIMIELHEKYPKYGFDRHKGYATKIHRSAILEHGPCPIHRKGFNISIGGLV